MSDATPAYARLIELIEFELELAAEGHLEQLEAAVAERGRFLATLPVPAPAEAEPLLRRAEALHGRLMIETRRIAEALEQRREARQLARRLARTYTSGGALDPAHCRLSA